MLVQQVNGLYHDDASEDSTKPRKNAEKSLSIKDISLAQTQREERQRVEASFSRFRRTTLAT